MSRVIYAVEAVCARDLERTLHEPAGRQARSESTLAISDKDIKLLWGRAGGHCSAPRCPEDLTRYLAKSGDIVLGQMAHVIGRQPGAARSDEKVGIDDSYENLILLCPNHHTLVDKAEHDHPVSLLRRWKQDWEQEVARRLMRHVSAQGGNSLEMRLWSYFNFDVLIHLYQATCPNGLALGPLPDLQADGMADAEGFPIRGTDERNPRTLFESWPQDKARRLQRFYSGLVEQMVHESPPLDLDAVWGIRKLRSLLYPTSFGFINRACIFAPIDKDGKHERRAVWCQAKGIKVSFEMDTRNVYSNSALTLHFRGRSQIAALLLIRSIERPPEKGRVRLEIKATPIALGTGFAPGHDRTPTIAWRDWQSDDGSE